MKFVAVLLTLITLALIAYKTNQVEVIPAQPEQKQEKKIVLPKATPQEKATLSDALKLITKEELSDNVKYLASEELEGRMSGKRGNVLAAEFVVEKLKKYEIPHQLQKFNIRSLNPGPKNEIGDTFTNNIIGYIEGEDKDQVIVIGAHLDHIGYGPSMSRSRKIAIHPGADDNASGSAALLEVAEAFSRYTKSNKLKKTISFQFYSGEEMGLLGSRFYCENPILPLESASIKKHVAMVNMDMIGYLGKGQFLVADELISSKTMRALAVTLKQKYPFSTNITSFGTGGSDHAPFYNKRIPIAFLHTGLHAHYHTPTDTHEKLNYQGMEDISKYAFEYVLVLAGQKDVDFNNKEFKAMSYDHDHGQVDIGHKHEH